MNACSVMLTNLTTNDYSVLAQPRCEIGPKLILDDSALLKPFSMCDMGPRLDEILLKNINEMNVFRGNTVIQPEVDSIFLKPIPHLSEDIQDTIESSYQAKECVKNLNCSQCNNKYSSAKSLYCHFQLKHKGEYKYVCKQCGRKFLNKHHLGTHVRHHIGILNFQCNICRHKFAQNPLLTHHLLSEHGKKFKCDHCSRTYGSTKALRNT